MHKDIRNAIATGEEAGLTFEPKSGHTFGWLVCTCGEHVKIYSTGKNPTGGAKIIRKFIAKHASHVKRN